MQQQQSFESERRNHFNIVGRPANLNDRIESVLHFRRKLNVTQGRDALEPPSRKSHLKPLNRSLRRQGGGGGGDTAALEYFPASLKKSKLTPLHTNTLQADEPTPKAEEKSKSCRMAVTKRGFAARAERLEPDECDKCDAYMQHTVATLLALAGKREYYLDRIGREQCGWFAGADAAATKLNREQALAVQEVLAKIKRFLTNKSRYKYRQKIQYQSTC